MAVNAALDAGARQVYSCSTHGVFTEPALDRIENMGIEEMVVTDTLPSAVSTNMDKVTVLSVASLLGEAMSRIHEGRSVGEALRRSLTPLPRDRGRLKRHRNPFPRLRGKVGMGAQ